MNISALEDEKTVLSGNVGQYSSNDAAPHPRKTETSNLKRAESGNACYLSV
jgi:hypothetical protein